MEDETCKCQIIVDCKNTENLSDIFELFGLKWRIKIKHCSFYSGAYGEIILISEVHFLFFVIFKTYF
jgi:hypothetical protein